MGFSRQEYWSGLPFPSPGDLPVPGIEPLSPALADDAPFCLAFSFLFPFCQYTDSFLLPFYRQDFYCLPAPAGFPDSRRNPLYLAYMDFSYPSRLPCSSLYTRHTVSQSPQCRCLPALCILTGFLPVNGFCRICSRQTAYLILETMFRILMLCMVHTPRPSAAMAHMSCPQPAADFFYSYNPYLLHIIYLILLYDFTQKEFFPSFAPPH